MRYDDWKPIPVRASKRTWVDDVLDMIALFGFIVVLLIIAAIH